MLFSAVLFACSTLFGAASAFASVPLEVTGFSVFLPNEKSTTPASTSFHVSDKDADHPVETLCHRTASSKDDEFIDGQWDYHYCEDESVKFSFRDEVLGLKRYISYKNEMIVAFAKAPLNVTKWNMENGEGRVQKDDVMYFTITEMIAK